MAERARRLDELLRSQGFGTRRECAALVASGGVRVDGRAVDDPGAAFDPAGADGLGLALDVAGFAWRWRERLVLLMHKPAGHECSARPSRWPSVLARLPEPLRRRGVQPVGRLDQDTTGLLILTDDGALNHRLASPKRHVAKVYVAATDRPLDDAQLARLEAGVTLRDDPRPARALAAERLGPPDARRLRLTIDEGRYHQVRRMIAAVGNHCVALHRDAFGPISLARLAEGGRPIAPGDWREADAAERRALDAAVGAGAPADGSG